ncbi:hypothetical protein OG707_02465 [Streptomyces sp. NBC_01465]|nr:hypothetical protein [Streptomyces sp. NBC_01465]
MKKMAPVSAALRQKTATLPALNARERNSRGGSIGAGARRSRTAKPARARSPAVRVPRASAVAQPTSLPRIRHQTTPRTPAASSS